ncbi:MAG: hypothetical protein GX361_03970 [Bacteroidales bacterium]|nr:hypothetical protein [Bacteroidales bacterium]
MCNEALHHNHVFDFFFSQIRNKNTDIAWRASWVLEKVSETNPKLFTDYHNRQLLELTTTNQHDSLQRLCLSILFNLPLSLPISVNFVNRCFEQMTSPEETVGVQVLSMKMLARICEAEPAFTQEFLSSLENTDDELFSKGFVAAKKHTIKKLRNRT